MNRQLRWLPYLFAAGAVLWLVELTRFAAYLVAPAGREVLKQALIDGGITRNLDSTLTTESVLIFFLGTAAAVLHAPVGHS